MKNDSDWYFSLIAKSLRIDVKVIKAYCKLHNCLPTTFYDLVKKRKIVSKNGKIHINRRSV